MAKKQIATFLGTGKHLSIVGSHCAAYSGDFASDAGNDTVYLNFATGAEYIVGTCQFHYGQSGQGDNYGYRIKFNGTTITTYTSTGGEEESEPDSSIPLIIPPFTKIECIGVNNSSGSARPLTVTIAGRVYA